MKINRTRIVLIVMATFMVVLAVVAALIGSRLQNQVNTKSFAGTCKEDCNRGCNADDGECHGYCNSLPSCGGVTPPGVDKGGCGVDGDSCTSFCCNGTTAVGCNKTSRCGEINGGPTKCSGNNIDGGKAAAGDCSGNGVGGTGGTGGSNANTKEACDAANGCWNTGKDNIAFQGCTLPGAEWCGPGNCVAGRTDLCKYTCTNKVAVNTNTACQAGSCQAGYCLSINNPNDATFGECVKGSASSTQACKGSTSGNCKLCDCSGDNQCDYNNGQECRKNCRTVKCDVAIPDCAQLDFNCQSGGDCGGANINKCANCKVKPSTSSSSKSSSSSTSSNSSVTPQSTCYKCTDVLDDGNECKTESVTGECSTLGAGWTSSVSCKTAQASGSCPTPTIPDEPVVSSSSSLPGTAISSSDRSGYMIILTALFLMGLGSYVISKWRKTRFEQSR